MSDKDESSQKYMERHNVIHINLKDCHLLKITGVKCAPCYHMKVNVVPFDAVKNNFK